MKRSLTKIICAVLVLVVTFSIAAPAVYATEGNTATVPATTTATPTKPATHVYYKNVPKEVADYSDAMAKAIADTIMSDPNLTTDLQRVQAAAEAVAYLCSISTYGYDTEKYYRTPAGLLVYGVYTCAGSTRTLGRILDFMGYEYTHVNENQYKHQWCVLTMDGQVGYADGMGGFAGYGEMHDGMQLPDGRVISFPE